MKPAPVKEGISRVLYSRLLDEHIQKNKEAKILDVGCGDAENFYSVRRCGNTITYVGIDADEESLKRAVRNDIPVVKADLERGFLPVKGPFDIIMITEVLEHLKSPPGIVTQVIDLLKDDGHVLVSLPNEYNILSRVRVAFDAGIDDHALRGKDKHLHFPTLSQSRKFMGEYFDVKKTVYWSSGGGRLKPILKYLPDSFFTLLAGVLPGLFARGAIFLCAKKATV